VGGWVIYGRYPVIIMVDVMPVVIVVVDVMMFRMFVFKSITCAK
jgi:hypothetical protein